MMYFMGVEGDRFLITCKNCNRTFKYDKKYLVAHDENGCNTNIALSCSCGYVSDGTYFGNYTPTVSKNSSQPHCPRCYSTDFSANKKGFTLGKAAVGGLLLGPVGLLGGFVGSGKVMVTCLKCGHQWKIGK